MFFCFFLNFENLCPDRPSDDAWYGNISLIPLELVVALDSVISFAIFDECFVFPDRPSDDAKDGNISLIPNLYVVLGKSLMLLIAFTI